jgi:hypothetical protein
MLTMLNYRAPYFCVAAEFGNDAMRNHTHGSRRSGVAVSSYLYYFIKNTTYSGYYLSI